MHIEDVLRGIKLLGLDAAPVIYFVEANPDFQSRCLPFFSAIDREEISAFTSTITLAETLAHQMRAGDTSRSAMFRSLLVGTYGISIIPVTVAVAERAARIRADYSLRTPDAVQIATALLSGCDAFLTNDVKLKRVSELRIIIISELET